MQTPAVVLAYTGKIARFIDNTDEVAFAKITPKQVNAALMRSWWPELRHLLEDSGNTSTDDWMTILRRLAGFATQAEQARFILNALSPPPPKKHPLQQTSAQDSAKRPNNNTPHRPLGKMARSTAFRGFRQIRRNKGGIRYLGASEPRENYRF